MSDRLKEAVERIVLLRLRVRSRRQARAKRRVRLSTLKTLEKTLRGASDLNAARGRTVFNVGMFIVLLDDDIAYFTEDLTTAIGDRRRRFVAKQEALLIYEAAEDLRPFLGRDFRDAVESLSASDEQMSRLNSVSSDIHRSSILGRATRVS